MNLRDAIQRIALEFSSYGRPRITAELKRRGWEVSQKRVHLHINASGRGDLFQLHQLKLDADLAPQSLPAYARLLLDVLEGDPTLAIRADEAEESWRIMDLILEVWKRGGVPLLEYPAGSEGPDVPS